MERVGGRKRERKRGRGCWIVHKHLPGCFLGKMSSSTCSDTSLESGDFKGEPWTQAILGGRKKETKGGSGSHPSGLWSEFPRASSMLQHRLSVHAAKPDDLRLIPRTHKVEEN